MSTELKVVMFTDQVGSTRNMAGRTPAEIKRVARDQDDLTADMVKQCRGKILKDTGDGHLIEFPSCTDAVRCGFLLQRRVAERNDSRTNERLRFDLHIGIDFGEVIVLPDSDLRANTANLAARVCSACPTGEVYFTEKVAKELNPREARAERVEVEPDKLKGVEDKPNIYRLADWLGPVESTPNPFIWRAGIAKPEDFFNRDAEQRTLRAYLHGRQNCQIVDPLRFGKTSLLLQIERIAPKWKAGLTVAYLDLHHPRCSTLERWLDRTSMILGWTLPATNLIEFIDRVEAMVAQGSHPVLCLDDFDELALRGTEFTRDFFMTLRACGHLGMSIVTASKVPLSSFAILNDPTSPFYNTFPLLQLTPFADSEAEDFITSHRSDVASFKAEERGAILGFAKGHPLALQIACFHVLEAKHRNEALSIAMRRAADEMKVLLPGGW